MLLVVDDADEFDSKLRRIKGGGRRCVKEIAATVLK
jgi:ribose 5-phosphate isomerase